MPDALQLPAKLDLSEVSELHKELVARKGEDVMLDLAEVKHIGALCLQVLIAAARQANASGNSFAMRNAGDRVIAQMHLMGTTPETILEGQTCH